jgi:hypothetical protein
LLSNPEAAHLVIQRRPVDAQLAGGKASVAFAGDKGSPYRLFL